MPRKDQRSTARKSRLLKLNIGDVRNRDRFSVEFEMNWQKLENAYRPLPGEAKDQISEALKEYIVQDEVEHNAPFLHDALSKISLLTNHAAALLEEHERRTSADRAVLSNVEARLSCTISEVLENYLDACADARTQLVEDSHKKGFIEGHAWRTMIWRLLDIVEKFGLPSKAAKPIKESQPRSPFVALVEEIQNQLPKVHWSFPQTHQALAARIVNIRRERKEWTQRKEIMSPNRGN
jgi:hypothetical protein